MSNFFNKSDLTRQDADKVVSETLKNCDDGELYLEESKSESILLDDNKIKSSNYSSDLGFGFRAISNEVVAYSYSNEISKDSLNNSSENLKSTLKSIKGTYNHEIPKYKFLYKFFKLPIIFTIFKYGYEMIAFFLYLKNKKQLKN